MATLGELKLRLIRLLGDTTADILPDPIESNTLEADLLLDGIKAGITAILPHYPKLSTFIYAQDGDITAYQLPEDLYHIEAVMNLSDGLYITELNLFNDVIQELQFQDGPYGYITFTSAIPTDGLKLFYSAKWTYPENDSDLIEPPDITHLGILLYAASYCKLPKASEAANTRQYLSKPIDSGTPVMNPEADMSLYFLRRFEDEMSRHPSFKRGQR